MGLYPYADQFPVTRAFPQQGRQRAEVLAEIETMARADASQLRRAVLGAFTLWFLFDQAASWRMGAYGNMVSNVTFYAVFVLPFLVADGGVVGTAVRATVEAINSLPDTNRVLRFVVPALGFPSATVTYRREERAAGTSKYPFLKMLTLSIDSVTGVSLFPLRLATYLGWIGGVLMFVASIVLFVASRTPGTTIPGWTSTVVIDPTTMSQTEVIEYGPVVTAQELGALLDKLEFLAKGASVIVLAGSLPRKVPEDFYATAIGRLRRYRCYLVLDSYGEPLRRGVRARPHLVTPNTREAEDLVGHEFHDEQDVVESEMLYELLEREIVPTFYERGRGDVPRRWVERMKNSISTICPFFNTHRMVAESTDRYLMTLVERCRELP